MFSRHHLVLVSINSPIELEESEIQQYVNDCLCRCEADRENVHTMTITTLPPNTTVGVLERIMQKETIQR